MQRSHFDELVHRVNNLLGTIAIQVAVARAEGSLAAHAQALDHIVESAKRTQDDVQRLLAVVARATTGGATGEA
ncbi:MAG TPA: hypothetical protein VFZ65_17920 [Planctomycetota bacterium]|nr:hypothetical protein [Planctomycetota bacterium]